jgi:hypothetical protein
MPVGRQHGGHVVEQARQEGTQWAYPLRKPVPVPIACLGTSHLAGVRSDFGGNGSIEGVTCQQAR